MIKRYLLCLFLLSVAPTLVAQVDLSSSMDFVITNASIETCLQQFSQQTGLKLAYSKALFPADKKISLRLKNQSRKKVLQRILTDVSLDFKVVGSQLVFFYKAKAPPLRTISGYLTNVETGEKLIAANIYHPDSRNGTTTNEQGFYSLTLRAGKQRLLFSYLGMQNKEAEINLQQNTRLDVELTPSLTLQEVVVTSRISDSLNPPITISTNDLTPERYNTLPTLGGEVDVIRLAHLIPGVQTGADGVGGIHVRGGSPDQNLVLLDGVTLYNPSHMAGVFSVFNSSAVKSAQLIKGSFPARYGGRLSSVLDVRTKEGNRKNFSREISLGITSAKVSIEGPIKKDTSSFILSYRRSLLNFYVRPISERIKNDKGQNGFSEYSFFDLNAKVNIALGQKDELFASFYRGSDDFENQTQKSSVGLMQDFSFSEDNIQELNWGNTAGALRWNHIFSDKLFSNTRLTYSRYAFESQDFYSYRDTVISQESSVQEFSLGRFNTLIEDVGLFIDLDYVASPQHYWRMGVSAIRHRFQPGLSAFTGNAQVSLPDVALLFSFLDSINNPVVETNEYNVYLEDQWQPTQDLMIKIGLRSSIWNVHGTTYTSLEPRVSSIYRLNPRWQFKSSFTYMTQYLHLLTTSGIGLPNDFWVPSTERVAPQRAWQVGAGFDHRFSDDIGLEVEAYYKRLDDVIAYQEGSSLTFIDAENYEDNVTTGVGWSYGIEALLSKKLGKTTGWIGYTLAWSRRQFDEVNQGRAFPFQFDRRHNIKLVLSHRFNDRWTLSGNWVYSSGIAITLPISENEVLIPDIFPRPVPGVNFGPKNSFRLPAYQRLDIGASYTFGKKIYEQLLNFGIYNVYNQQNPLYYRLSRGDELNQSQRSRQFVQVSLLPVTPYVSYQIRF